MAAVWVLRIKRRAGRLSARKIINIFHYLLSLKLAFIGVIKCHLVALIESASDLLGEGKVFGI